MFSSATASLLLKLKTFRNDKPNNDYKSPSYRPLDECAANDQKAREEFKSCARNRIRSSLDSALPRIFKSSLLTPANKFESNKPADAEGVRESLDFRAITSPRVAHRSVTTAVSVRESIASPMSSRRCPPDRPSRAVRTDRADRTDRTDRTDRVENTRLMDKHVPTFMKPAQSFNTNQSLPAIEPRRLGDNTKPSREESTLKSGLAYPATDSNSNMRTITSPRSVRRSSKDNIIEANTKSAHTITSPRLARRSSKDNESEENSRRNVGVTSPRLRRNRDTATTTTTVERADESLTRRRLLMDSGLPSFMKPGATILNMHNTDTQENVVENYRATNEDLVNIGDLQIDQRDEPSQHSITTWRRSSVDSALPRVKVSVQDDSSDSESNNSDETMRQNFLKSPRGVGRLSLDSRMSAIKPGGILRNKGEPGDSSADGLQCAEKSVSWADHLESVHEYEADDDPYGHDSLFV